MRRVGLGNHRHRLSIGDPVKFIVAIALLFPIAVFGYTEACLPNITVPSNLEQGQLEASIQHRFSGRFDTAGTTFLGFATPAWIDLNLRYMLLKKLEVYTGFYNTNKEVELGGAYTLIAPSAYLRFQLDGTFYNFSSYDTTFKEHRDNAGFLGLDLQTDPFFRCISPTVNGGYDFLKQRWGLGLGVSVTLVDGFDLLGEYFPIIDKNKDSTSIQTTNVFSFGIKFTTAGHHFLLFVQNSPYIDNIPSIGSRHCMFGTENNNLHFGFAIHRMFDFK